MLRSISSSISLVSDATATNTASGPAAPLGSTYTIPSSDSDRGLVAITTSTGVVAGDARTVLASGEELVSLAGGDGELELIYVKNATGADIKRGAIVMVDFANGSYNIKYAPVPGTAASASQILGVTLFVIPTAKTAWIVKRGVVKVATAGSAIAIGSALKSNGTEGRGVIVTAGDPSVVSLLEEGGAGAGSLSKAYVSA